MAWSDFDLSRLAMIQIQNSDRLKL